MSQSFRRLRCQLSPCLKLCATPDRKSHHPQYLGVSLRSRKIDDCHLTPVSRRSKKMISYVPRFQNEECKYFITSSQFSTSLNANSSVLLTQCNLISFAAQQDNEVTWVLCNFQYSTCLRYFYSQHCPLSDGVLWQTGSYRTLGCHKCIFRYIQGGEEDYIQERKNSFKVVV